MKAFVGIPVRRRCRVSSSPGRICTQRLFSSTNCCHDGITSSFIPRATWSIHSLELNAQHDKLPRGELRRLARLALLDLDRLPEDLEQDLANMMHMVDQVSAFAASRPDLFDHAAEDATGSFTYDYVKGVDTAPFRAIQDTLYEDEASEAKSVWDNYLEPNTIRQGGAHQYFSISTKQTTSYEE